jgi:hypothetical protein
VAQQSPQQYEEEEEYDEEENEVQLSAQEQDSFIHRGMAFMEQKAEQSRSDARRAPTAATRIYKSVSAAVYRGGSRLLRFMGGGSSKAVMGISKSRETAVGDERYYTVSVGTTGAKGRSTGPGKAAVGNDEGFLEEDIEEEYAALAGEVSSKNLVGQVDLSRFVPGKDYMNKRQPASWQEGYDEKVTFTKKFGLSQWDKIRRRHQVIAPIMQK